MHQKALVFKKHAQPAVEVDCHLPLAVELTTAVKTLTTLERCSDTIRRIACFF
jgi:hypothetical protein